MIKNLLIPTKENQYEPYLLSKAALAIYTFILFMSNIALPLLPGFAKEASASDITGDKVIELVNSEREIYGLPSLKTNVLLTAAAYSKAENMFANQYWDHYGPDGASPWGFFKQGGYVYTYAGENLGKGFKTSEGLHQAWMTSPTHRENILSGDYQDIGVAVMDGKLLGENVTLVVQMFGNTTTDVVKTPKSQPSVENARNESGDIKSIKITQPQDGSISNDRNLSVKGNANGYSTNYSIKISEESTEVGSVDVAEDDWTIQKTTDWEEGLHELRAELFDGDTISASDTVSFEIDSTPPKIDSKQLNVKILRSEYQVSALVLDPNPLARIVTKSRSYGMELKEDGLMHLSLNKNDIGDTVTLLASDQAGNIKEMDITSLFKEKKQVVKAKFIGSIAVNNIAQGVTFFLGLFLSSLFVLEVVYLVKHKQIKLKHHSLFRLGLLIIIILVGNLTGLRGSIF